MFFMVPEMTCLQKSTIRFCNKSLILWLGSSKELICLVSSSTMLELNGSFLFSSK